MSTEPPTKKRAVERMTSEHVVDERLAPLLPAEYEPRDRDVLLAVLEKLVEMGQRRSVFDASVPHRFWGGSLLF